MGGWGFERRLPGDGWCFFDVRHDFTDAWQLFDDRCTEAPKKVRRLALHLRRDMLSRAGGRSGRDVPETEVQARQSDFAKFGLASDTLFQSERPGYLAFLPSIAAKPAIKTTLECDTALQKTLTVHHKALEAWWGVARDDFAQLRDGKRMPEVPHELPTTRTSRSSGMACHQNRRRLNAVGDLSSA